MKNIALIGFMGAGKSTVAEALQKRYGMEIVEMDALIIKREKMPIPEIFAQKGEAYFREKETALLAELQEKENVVISCGGGVPMRKENVEIMRRNSHVVWLCAKPETILERVRHSHDRPLLEGRKNMEYITELMEARREKYEAAADLRVAVDKKSAETIADENIEKMKSERQSAKVCEARIFL